jgi:acyl-CoA synthetase (NDP forming)
MNSKYAELDAIFMPRSVVIIGGSPQDNFTNCHLNTRMRDNLYVVNPNYAEVKGKKCYPSVLDIREPLDYGIIAVPARLALNAVKQCIEKGLKAVHVYTSGFAETGLPEGIALEKELKELAGGRIRLIGPNCMGIYCPKSGLSFNIEGTNEEGGIGVIAQSGTFAQAFIYSGRSMGFKMSKVVSYGNAVDLDSPDYLEYLADDPDTTVIALYIEGTRRGARLRSALRYAAGRKPVIVLKGGVTDEGRRVAASHTGALAGAGNIWSGMFKQAGAVQVEAFDELLNTTLALSLVKPPRGRGVGIVTYSGGFGVVQTDMCIKAGLKVPGFSPAGIEKLRKVVPAAGTMMGNPLDSWQLFYNYSGKGGTLGDVIRIVAEEKDIHSMVLQFDVINWMLRIWKDDTWPRLEAVARNALEACRHARESAGKPLIWSIFLDPFTDSQVERELTMKLRKMCQDEGFPVCLHLNAAIRAIAYMCEFSLRNKNIQ